MSTRYEYYNTGDDNIAATYGVLWKSQTFTIGNVGSNVSQRLESIKVRGTKVGSPGTIAFELRTVSAGLPTSTVIATGSYNGNSFPAYPTRGWSTAISMTACTLLPNTTYALVASVASGDTSNYFGWALDTSSPTYTGGNACDSSNSGTSWYSTGNDYLFEIWGTYTCVGAIAGDSSLPNTILTITRKIIGTVAGVSGVDAVLLRCIYMPIADLVCQSSVANSLLRIVKELVPGDFAMRGLSTSNGTLTVKTKIAGAITPASSVTGALSIERWLSGTITCISGIPNTTLWTGLPISGTISTSSGTVGALSISRGLAGTITVSSTCSAYLEADAISGSLTATSSVTGVLSVTRKVIGSLSATSSVPNSNLGSIKELIATVTAQSGMVGPLHVLKELIGITITTQSDTSGLLVVMRIGALSGAISASCSLSGRLEVLREFVGTISAQSGNSGHISILREIIGTVTCTGSVTGAVTNIVSISRTTVLTSTVDGGLKRTRTVIALATCAGTVDGSLSTVRKLTGLITAQSSVTGSMPVFALPKFLLPTSVRIRPIFASSIRVNAGLKRDWYAIVDS